MASGRVKGPLRLRNSGSGLALQEPVSPRALRFPALATSWSSGRRMFWGLPGTSPRAPLGLPPSCPPGKSWCSGKVMSVSCACDPGPAWESPGCGSARPRQPSLPHPVMTIWTVTPLAPGSLPTPLSGLGRPNQIPSEAHPPTPAPTLWRLPIALWFVGQRAPSSAPLAPGLRCCGQGWAQVLPSAVV